MKKKDINLAAKIFSNFTMFANIQSQLESGCVYGANDAASKIISICIAEQQRLLTEYDVWLRSNIGDSLDNKLDGLKSIWLQTSSENP